MQQKKSKTIATGILIANLLIMLFPPIHLGMAKGSMPMALTFFLGSGLILVLSMVVLRSLDASGTEE
ncbi:MAG: hypothetical protein IAE87_04265 [Rhodobacteraceae bacterium]|jgi:hypothetical protein|nr:hypothetical protein [Paracoccaceae bacterium]